MSAFAGAPNGVSRWSQLGSAELVVVSSSGAIAQMIHPEAVVAAP